MRVYYLDDEADLCAIFEEFIADDDTIVETFLDAGSAILRCAEEPPDLLFIDYRLADTSGDKVAAKVGAHIPKILVTGELEMIDNPIFLSTIAKPYKLSKIKKIVESRR